LSRREQPEEGSSEDPTITFYEAASSISKRAAVPARRGDARWSVRRVPPAAADIYSGLADLKDHSSGQDPDDVLNMLLDHP
jgi:hypothetical protein